MIKTTTAVLSLVIFLCPVQTTLAQQCPPGKNCSPPARSAPPPRPAPVQQPAPRAAPVANMPSRLPPPGQNSGPPRQVAPGQAPGPSHSYAPSGQAPPRSQSPGQSYSPGHTAGGNEHSSPPTARTLTPSRPQQAATPSQRTFGGTPQGGATSPRRFGEAPQSAHPSQGPDRRFGAAPSASPAGERRFGGAPGGRPVPVRSAHGEQYLYHGRRFAPFRVAEYRWPGGYSYIHYDVHMSLPTVFWSTDYVITDYAAYNIVEPPLGQRWVRYGPDMLLINGDTGEVDDVIYGAFVVEPDAGDQPPQ